MRIAITSSNTLQLRYKHFLNTLKKDKHKIVEHNDIAKIPQSDIWIIDYVYTSNYIQDNIDRFNSLLPQILKFRGGVFLLNVGDSCPTFTAKLNSDLIERIDGVIVLNKFEESSPHSKGISKKTILIPRFTIDFTPYSNDLARENKIFFVGKITGSDFFNNKNWRIEAFNKILNNSFLKDNFYGWLHPDDRVLPERLRGKDYYLSVVGAKDKLLSLAEYYSELKKYQISLCLPGNTAWGYRHLHSLVCMNTIISFELSSDSGEWLFQNMFNNSFYFLKNDLSNFELVLTDSIKKVDESIIRAQKSYETYQEYFELLPDNTYQDHVWKIVKDSFASINFHF